MTKAKFLEKTFLSDFEKERVFHLWNCEYPFNLNYSTLTHFEDYLAGLEDQLHVLVLLNDKIQGWYFEFLREDKRWFGLILSSDIQGRGVGTKLLNKIKATKRELHGWIILHNSYSKANGQPYKSPHDFYLKNGFHILSNVRLETENISAVKIEWKALQ